MLSIIVSWARSQASWASAPSARARSTASSACSTAGPVWPSNIATMVSASALAIVSPDALATAWRRR